MKEEWIKKGRGVLWWYSKSKNEEEGGVYK